MSLHYLNKKKSHLTTFHFVYYGQLKTFNLKFTFDDPCKQITTAPFLKALYLDNHGFVAKHFLIAKTLWQLLSALCCLFQTLQFAKLTESPSNIVKVLQQTVFLKFYTSG